MTWEGHMRAVPLRFLYLALLQFVFEDEAVPGRSG